MNERTKENLMQGADTDQLLRGIAPDPVTGQGDSRVLESQNIKEVEAFDPMAALEGMGVAAPEPIELPDAPEVDLTTGTEAERNVHEYGSGVFTSSVELNGELVLGVGTGVALPDADVSIFTAGNTMPIPAEFLADRYAIERAEQQDKPLAMRFNEGKLRFDLIPPEAVEGLASIYTMGAKKYSDRNWEKGLQLMGCFASLMRHAWKWASGEDLDQESGLHHMDHVAWNAVAISTFFKRGRKDLDDRPGANA